jgi:hypothetical protein
VELSGSSPPLWDKGGRHANRQAGRREAEKPDPLFGNPGIGTTHGLCGIPKVLVCQGRKTRFATGSLVRQQLLVVRRNVALAQVLKRMRVSEGIRIDENGSG